MVSPPPSEDGDGATADPSAGEIPPPQQGETASLSDTNPPTTDGDQHLADRLDDDEESPTNDSPQEDNDLTLTQQISATLAQPSQETDEEDAVMEEEDTGNAEDFETGTEETLQVEHLHDEDMTETETSADNNNNEHDKDADNNSFATANEDSTSEIHEYELKILIKSGDKSVTHEQKLSALIKQMLSEDSELCLNSPEAQAKIPPITKESEVPQGQRILPYFQKLDNKTNPRFTAYVTLLVSSLHIGGWKRKIDKYLSEHNILLLANKATKTDTRVVGFFIHKHPGCTMPHHYAGSIRELLPESTPDFDIRKKFYRIAGEFMAPDVKTNVISVEASKAQATVVDEIFRKAYPANDEGREIYISFMAGISDPHMSKVYRSHNRWMNQVSVLGLAY